MKYTILNDILSDLKEENLDLIDKIWLNSKERHFLFIGTLDNYETIKNSTWYSQLRKSSQKQIDEQFIASSQIGKKEEKLIISNIGDDSFSLEEAVDFLQRPLTIILEHVEYDKYFIDAIIRCFDIGRKIKYHYDNGWLIFTNGGGNNIVNVLNGMKERFEKNKSIFPKPSYSYLRTFVIIDSDKKYPSKGEVLEHKKGLLEKIKQCSPYHVTLKREMENYLPVEIYSEIPENDIYKTAFLDLTPSQKDYFDIEKGFSNKNFNQLEAGIAMLYDSIDVEYKKIFRKKKLVFKKDDGKTDSFKARFSKLFKSKKINRKNLEKRAASTDVKELELILQKICDLL